MQILIKAFLVFSLVFGMPAVMAQDEPKAASFEQALAYVQKRQWGFSNMSPFELQVHYRIRGAKSKIDYPNDPQDAPRWLTVMNEDTEQIYARICAAYFLAETNEEARRFLATQMASKNLRHRYNAAEAVRFYIWGEDIKNEWAFDLLLKHLSNGSLDGSGVTSSPPGTIDDYPAGDRDDIISDLLDSICWNLRSPNRKRAVPTLIGVLERKPDTPGAAAALGEIGDPKAIPILMDVLKNQPRSRTAPRAVTALGQFKAKQAVPLLIPYLQKETSEQHYKMNEAVLGALLEIGDKRAIKPIKAFIAKSPKETAAVAKRILAQLEADDPAAGLLKLLAEETYEPERSDLIEALVRYPDNMAVVQKLASIAKSSDSAFMRREAIYALWRIDTPKTLRILAELLDADFPANLKAEWGWKSPPKDFNKYFHPWIHKILKDKTGQEFPSKSAPWITFLESAR